MVSRRLAGVKFLLGIVLVCASIVGVHAQTFYSRNAAPNLPREWSDVTAWTTNPDGSGGPVAQVPQRGEDVVILSGHSMTISGFTDNGAAAATPDGLGRANVGPFVSSSDNYFYHTGDVSVEFGATLITTVRSMYEGTTFVAGTVDAGADFLNLGIMFFTASSAFTSGDDLQLSGNSNTRIDIPNAANSFTNDDIYLDHTDAWLCGLGVVEVNTGGAGGIINLNNGATVAQICSALTIIGCSSGPCAGTGTFNPTPPALTGNTTDLNYTENAIIAVQPTLALTYGELFLTTATISISSGYVNGEDELALPATSGITSSFNTGTGELTLTGYATVAQWQAIMRNVTYENLSDNPSTGIRTASFEITDGFASSNTLSRNIIIIPVNDPPDVSTISGTPTALQYTENDGPVDVDDEIEVSDPDDTDLEGALITISSNYVSGEDELSFANTPSISGSWNSGTGELTLTGTATIAEYQAALRFVKYENTSDVPNTNTRTVGFQVDDGDILTPVAFTRDIEITAVNDQPSITSTAPTTATEDVVYTYTATVVDPDDANDGTQLSWSLANEPAGMVVSATGVVTWTPLEGVTTSGTVTLSVEDGGEDGTVAATEDFTIVVTPVNDPPSITSTAPTTATEDVLYTYTATVTDPDDLNNGVDLTWSLSNEPAGMVVSSTGEVTWTPGEGITTSGTVSLTVSDGGENGATPDTEDFVITVTGVNDPPVITSTAPTTATEDILYSYTPTVADPDDLNDGTQLTWSLSGEPAGMTVGSTGIVQWTPLEGVLTSGSVTLQVEDGGENGAGPDTEVFTITVTPVNDPPVITSSAPTSATEEVPYMYTATVSDPDDANNGTDLTWSLSNEPAGMSVNATGQVTWTPAEGITTSGTVTLTVQDGGEDGAGPDTEVFTISVTSVNDPPVITTTAPTTATEDILYTYTAGVSDPDDNNDGTELTWSLSNEPAGMTVSTTGVVSWTPTEGVLTSGTVTLTVADGGENGAAPDTEDFTITVTAVNDPPVITSTAPTTATEETLYTYTATVADPDDVNNGTDLVWSLSNEPAGMTVSATGQVTWTPAEGITTSGTVTLTVVDGGEDGAGPDTEDFTVTVTAVNDPPTITSTAPTTATEDILYTYTATVTDPDDNNDGTQLTWSLTNEPSGMIVSTTGVVSWTPGEGVLTSGTVTLSVADGGENGSTPDTEDFVVTVTPVNDAPVISSIAPATAQEETLYTYTASVSDPDDNNNGVDLTWSLTNEPAGMIVSTTGVVTWTPAEGVLSSGTVTLTVQDGGEDGALPDSEDFTVTVTPVNDAPVITTTAPTSATEDILYTYSAGVSDPDDLNDGVQLTWSLTNAPAGMVVDPTGNVTWTPGEGVLSSGTVTLTVQDGGENGALPDTEDFVITVTPVNDQPVITSAAPTNATEDVLYTYTPVVSDPDDLNDGTELVWSLTNEPAGMLIDAMGVVSWTPTEGVLTSGTVTLTVQDGGEDGTTPDSEDFTISVAPVNDQPQVNAVVTNINYTEGDGAVILDGAMTITDVDNTSMAVATIMIASNYVQGEDVLGFTNQPGITGAFDAVAGTLTLSGASSIANYEAALQLVTYENTSATPDVSTRSLDISVNDGSATSSFQTITITITSIADPPQVTVTATDLSYTENEGAKVIDAAFNVTDLDDTELESALISISGYQQGEDVLGFVDQAGISGVFDAVAGTLSLSGTSALANYQVAIQSVTYENVSEDPDLTVRTISITTNDGESSSVAGTRNIVITAVNDAPTIMGTATATTYVEGSGPMIVDDQLTPDDVDNTMLNSAEASLGASFITGEDLLAATPAGAISVSFNSTTGVLSFSGTASIADYQATLRSITYENTVTEPTATMRTLSVIVDDGSLSSTSFERDIMLSTTNDPPIVVDASGSPIDTVRFTINEDEPANLCILVTDPESNSVAVATISSSTSGFDNGDGSDLCFDYTPEADFNGVVYASVELCDNGSPSACTSVVVEVTVLPVNDTPIAVDDEITGIEDTQVTDNVLTNDVDPDGDNLLVSVVLVAEPLNGSVIMNTDGSFTYDPVTDFAGVDSFVYEVCDSADPALCAEAEVTITLTDVEDPVVAYQALTPNDDAFNDAWVVEGIEQFPNNKVQIFDRWSSLVYQMEGYNNADKVWTGQANEGISTGELPNGTYFYVIELGDGNEIMKGFVELKRN